MRKTFLIVFFFTFLACPGHCEFFDGSELYEKCVDYDIGKPAFYEEGLCEGYIMGVITLYSRVVHTEEGWNNLYCPPDGIKSNQTTLVVKNYLENNPSQLNKKANELVLNAIFEAFPCD